MAIALGGKVANAADLLVKAPPPILPVFTWAGPYLDAEPQLGIPLGIFIHLFRVVQRFRRDSSRLRWNGGRRDLRHSAPGSATVSSKFQDNIVRAALIYRLN